MSDPITDGAASIQTLLEATVPALKRVYVWEPGLAGIDQLPAAIIGLPDVARTGVAQAETELGHDDWRLTYPVVLYFALDDAPTAMTQAATILAAYIAAVDTRAIQAADPSIDDAKVTTATATEYVDEARPLMGYETTLELLKLV